MNSITKYEQQSKDLDTLRAMAAVAIRSGKYTSDYNESTVLNIFMTARALGVDPMLALNGGFNIIKGKINMSAHFMSGLARRAGHSMKIIEMSDQKCVIIAKRKDNEDSLKYEMTLEEAQRAGLTGKQNWQLNPKQMLHCACVRNVFRILFSDIAIPYDADEMNVEETLSQSEDVGYAQTIDPISNQPPIEIIDPRPKEARSEASAEMTPLDSLRASLQSDSIPADRLEEWIKLHCHTKNLQPEEVAKKCLLALPSFKKSYSKWLNQEPIQG